jgi:hypothetical protein
MVLACRGGLPCAAGLSVTAHLAAEKLRIYLVDLLLHGKRPRSPIFHLYTARRL